MLASSSPHRPGSTGASVAFVSTAETESDHDGKDRKRSRTVHCCGTGDVFMDEASIAAPNIKHPFNAHHEQQQTPPRNDDGFNTNVNDGSGSDAIAYQHSYNHVGLLLDAFDQLQQGEQDVMLRELIGRCSKRQLSFVANLVMPRLKVDILRLLPHEIALHVLSHLPARSLCRLACVSRYHRVLANDDHLWRCLYRHHAFPAAPSCDTSFPPPTPTTPEAVSLIRGLSMSSVDSLPDAIIPPHHHASTFLSALTSSSRYKSLFEAHYTIRLNWVTGKCTHHSIEGPRSAIVTCLQFRHDVLVVATDNTTFGVIDLIDCSTGHRVKRFEGHEGGVWAVEFNQTKLLSGGCDRDVRIRNVSTPYDGTHFHCPLYEIIERWKVWDVDTLQSVYLLQGHHAQIYSVALDGDTICSGSLDADVRVWSLSSGQCLFTLEAHDALVGHIQIRNTTLLTGGSDGRICLWDLDTGEMRKRIAAHPNSVSSVQFDDQRIVSGGEDGVKIWDVETGRMVRRVFETATGVWRLQFDERRLVAAVQHHEQTCVEMLDFHQPLL